MARDQNVVIGQCTQARDTLTETVCDGLLTRSGTCGSLCTEPMSAVLSFPKLISLSLAHQGLETKLIAYSTKVAFNKKLPIRMSFYNNEHVEWVLEE